jgi:methyl-accepting chemotaxis protein
MHDSGTPHAASIPARPFRHHGFFAHHGVWAPGVRLFRRMGFGGKASLISLAFLVPLVVVAWTWMAGINADIAFAEREREGVHVIAKLEPWQVEVQRQRRRVMAGQQAEPDMAAIETARRAVQEEVVEHEASLQLGKPMQALRSLHDNLQLVAKQPGPARDQAFQAYVDAVAQFRVTVLDKSYLTLDPDQDTYYLMALATDSIARTVESISRGRSLAGAALRSGTMDIATQRLLYAVWRDGEAGLDAIQSHVARTAEVLPDVGQKLKVEAAMSAAQTYLREAERAWFGPEFRNDQAAMDKVGQAAVDALRATSTASVALLDERLAARINRLERQRNLEIGVMAVFVLLAGYLFYSFFAVMDGGLEEVGRHLRAMTEGDLTTTPRPWGKDEAAELMLLLDDMQKALRTMVLHVRTASDGIVHASSEIADGSLDLSARTEQTAANLEESAASMEQIGATVRNTAEHTNEANRIAADNAQVAQRGGEVMQQMVATMEQIHASSSRIADIIGTIDGIAFQTNILALNAAVEAARAGEHGRGFAVVAAEVRALAQRSAGAAAEVRTLINDSVERVQSGTGIVREAGSTIGEVVGGAQRIRGLLDQVRQSAQEQAQGVAQVTESVQDLDRSTQQNAALVEQTAAAASSLKDQANALAAEVARFRLPEAHGSMGHAAPVPRAPAVPAVGQGGRRDRLALSGRPS